MTETACDILVIGAGPAGIAAATRAAEGGAKVALYDMQAVPGGQVWRGQARARRDARAVRWFDALARSTARFRGERRLIAVDAATRSVVFDDGGSGERVRYARAIVATGARELVLPCPGWTLSGVYGAGGLQVLVKGGWPIAGKRIVVAGSGPLLPACAASLRAAGADVTCIVEQAGWRALLGFAPALLREPRKLAQAVSLARALRGVAYETGCWVGAVHGEHHVRAVTLRNARGERHVDCDTLALGHGLVPNTDVAQAFGCALRDGAVAVDETLRTSVDGIYCAGEGTGIGGVEQALAQGELAAAHALDRAPARALRRRVAAARRFGATLAAQFALRAELHMLAQADTVLCRCEDVRHGDVAACASPRAARLHTRFGMGHCQGRTCGAIGNALFGWPLPAPRLPLAPARIASLAAHPVIEQPEEYHPS